MKSILLGLAAAAAIGTPAAAESWNAFSRTPNNAFMADTDSIATVDGTTRVKVATVPLRGPADDQSHTVETFEFQCEASRWRTAGVLEYGPDGAEVGAYPEEGAAWEAVRANTIPDYLKQIACAGARSEPPIWPTIAAFVATRTE